MPEKLEKGGRETGNSHGGSAGSCGHPRRTARYEATSEKSDGTAVHTAGAQYED